MLPRPDVAPADDVRGLGAILYTLLTSRWPLSRTDAARAGLGRGRAHARGRLRARRRGMRPGVPIELDTLVQGTLGPSDELGHVRTAAAVHVLLTEVVAEDDRIALFPPAHDGLPSSPGDVWQDRDRPPPPADPKRRRKLAIGLSALGAGHAGRARLPRASSSPRRSPTAGGRPSSSPAARPRYAPAGPGNAAVAPPDEPDRPPPAAGGPAVAAGVEVYDRSGDRDNSGRVSRVIDGNPTSGWNTFTYKQQFPALKPGVGIMVSFASAVQLSELTIDSPSPGTVVQVRSAPSAEAEFPDTTQLAEVTLGHGPTPVSLDGSQPVTHVLLWITKLGGSCGREPHRDHRAAVPAGLSSTAPTQPVRGSASSRTHRPTGRGRTCRDLPSAGAPTRPAPTRSCSPHTGPATAGRSAELADRHYGRLWGVAVRILRHPEDAADAVQEALVAAYRAGRRLPGRRRGPHLADPDPDQRLHRPAAP